MTPKPAAPREDVDHQYSLESDQRSETDPGMHGGAATMSSPSIPGYDQLALIGSGGFSQVYRAEQSKLNRRVALKVLNFGLSEESDRRSFERETQLLGRVSTHPNIVTVYDTAFTDSGNPCIVMEHYPGGSLDDLIKHIERLSVPAALEVGVAIASALEASHRAGVVHCDLKPQNILISQFGQPVLGDFGISTFAEERTRTGAGVAFTLSFAAPEIVEGESPNPRTDIYSLAATLYTALAGRSPFGGPTGDNKKPSMTERARRILLEDAAPLTTFGVPSEVDNVIRGALAKDPANRPATAVAFAQALHTVGQSLGFGTSSPQTSEQGALPVYEPRLLDLTDVEFTATGTLAPSNAAPSEIVPQPAAGLPLAATIVADSSGDTPETAHRNPVHHNPVHPEPLPVATQHGDDRKKLVGLLVVALAVVAVVTFGLLSRGGSRTVVASANPTAVADPTGAAVAQPATVSEPTAAPEPTTGPEPTTVPEATAAPEQAAAAEAAVVAEPEPTQIMPIPTVVAFSIVDSEGNIETDAAVAALNPMIEITLDPETPCSFVGCIISATIEGFAPNEPIFVDVFKDGGTERFWFFPMLPDADGAATLPQPLLAYEGTFVFNAYLGEGGDPTQPLATTTLVLDEEPLGVG